MREVHLTPAGPQTQGKNPIIEFPYEISFPDSEASPATRVKIEEYLARLSHFYDRIIACRVFVRIPHRHSAGKRSFHIHIQLDIPGKRLAVSRDPGITDDHTDMQMAVRDAFEKLTRQLEDFVKHRKSHKGNRDAQYQNVNKVAP